MMLPTVKTGKHSTTGVFNIFINFILPSAIPVAGNSLSSYSFFAKCIEQKHLFPIVSSTKEKTSRSVAMVCAYKDDIVVTNVKLHTYSSLFPMCFEFRRQ